MQVTKLRGANDNGYFVRLSDGLHDARARAAAVVDTYEEQERWLEALRLAPVRRDRTSRPYSL